MNPLVIAQGLPKDTSSAAAAVFGVLILVGVISVVALTSPGRRSLLPVIAILIGLLIGATSISEWLRAGFTVGFTVLTLLGLFFAVLLVLGGLGALREGLAVPEVDGVEPETHPSPPRITPDS